MHLVGDNHTLLIIEKEAMAPCTYVRHTIGVALDSHTHFRSLEFTDIDGPAPINSLLAGQAMRFGDQDFVADRLGQLRLNDENAAPPHMLMPDHGPVRASPMIIDSDALACKINAYLGPNPEPKLSRHVFYMLVNAFAQLFGNRPLPLKAY